MAIVLQRLLARALDRLETMLKHRDVAAFIMELLLYASEDSIVLMPPLTVDEATCAEALEIVAGAA